MGQQQSYRHYALLVEETVGGRMMVFHCHGTQYETFSVHTLPEDNWLLAYTPYGWDRLDRFFRTVHGLKCGPWSLEMLNQMGIPLEVNPMVTTYNKLWYIILESSHRERIKPLQTSICYIT